MKYILLAIGAFLLLTLLYVPKGETTVYDLFSQQSLFGTMPHKTLHFRVNGQDMDMIIGKQKDDGALLSSVRNNRYLPFYRDKNGGLAVHYRGRGEEENTVLPGALMSRIEPIMGFVNKEGHSTKYAGLRLDKRFDIKSFMEENAHDSEDLPVYPSAVKINTIQAEKFSIGHYRAQATANAVMVYYDSRLQSQGYKKLRTGQGIALYRSGNILLLVNAEEKEDYVSILTYAVKQK